MPEITDKTQIKELVIVTPYGNRYRVDTRGRIASSQWGHSDDWIMVGIYPTHPFVRNWKHLIRFEDLTEERIKQLDLRYKNGHPRYTVVDLDHGTRRVWGNTAHHGIKYMYWDEVVD